MAQRGSFPPRWQNLAALAGQGAREVSEGGPGPLPCQHLSLPECYHSCWRVPRTSILRDLNIQKPGGFSQRNLTVNSLS